MSWCFRRTCAIALALMGLANLAVAPVQAALSVTLQAISPAAAGDTATSPTNNTIPFTLTSGQFSASGSGLGEDFFSTPATMDLTTVTLSSAGAGEAWIIFSMNGVDSPVGLGEISQRITGMFVIGTGSISLVTYGDLDNILYTTEPVSNPPTVVGTPAVTAFGGSSSVSWTSDNQFSMTQVLKINFESAGTVSLSTDSFSRFDIPEPTTMAVWGAFSAFGLIVATRRRKAALAALN